MTDYMIPGLAVGVSRYGKHVWVDAFGQSDVENTVTAHKESVFRMGSISKSLTSGLIGRLMDKGLIDLHRPIHHYLKSSVFPVKQWKGKDVNITLSQLMSHTSGLRVTDLDKDFIIIPEYKDVSESIAQFKDEPLIAEPGTEYHYSNYGYQVVGAVVEAVMDDSFDKVINKFFEELAMKSTVCERHDMIIKHKVRDYMRSDSPYITNRWNEKFTKNLTNVKLLNSLLFDDLLSFEAQWPSGGIVTNTEDLLTFANFMLNSYKGVNHSSKSEHLNKETAQTIWTPVIDEFHDDLGSHRKALAWTVTELKTPIKCEGTCKMPSQISKLIWNAGGLSGITTLVMILPEQEMVLTVFSNNSSMDEILETVILYLIQNFMI